MIGHASAYAIIPGRCMSPFVHVTVSYGIPDGLCHLRFLTFLSYSVGPFPTDSDRDTSDGKRQTAMVKTAMVTHTVWRYNSG